MGLLDIDVRRLAIALRLLACAASVGACGGRVDEPRDEAARYLDEPEFRRERLAASLVNPDNGYSRLRLARYATGGSGDWDALPAWNPPVATIASDGSLRGDERPLAWSAGEPDWIALGEEAFFRYPTQLASLVAPALTGSSGLARFGLWDDAARGAGGLVSVRFEGGTRGLAMTCSTCHARVLDGRLVPGRANDRLDVGALAVAYAGGGDDRSDPRSEWGPGRVDVAPPPGEEPIAIPDLRPVALQTHLHRAGAVRNDPIALAVRVETLVITAHDQVIRPPREIAVALARYLASLAPASPPPPTRAGSVEARGADVFSARCARCHAPPGYAGPPVPLSDVATDPRVGESADRGTFGYRVPSLRNVSTRGPLLHDGSLPDVRALLDPARVLPDRMGVSGHAYGLDLDDSDREAIARWLDTL